MYLNTVVRRNLLSYLSRILPYRTVYRFRKVRVSSRPKALSYQKINLVSFNIFFASRAVLFYVKKRFLMKIVFRFLNGKRLFSLYEIDRAENGNCFQFSRQDQHFKQKKRHGTVNYLKKFRYNKNLKTIRYDSVRRDDKFGRTTVLTCDLYFKFLTLN